ncbi:LppM family (lipo)protein [Georgenia wangjunii]|uniref:LppM family (lipo)protein n=1 Tax=Georgenia wangjunii TaxID=3117730 RepID=UPI002F26579A
MSPARPRATRRLTALLLLPLLLVLGGCFRMDLGVQINADESLDITMEFEDLSGLMTEQDISCEDLESEMGVGDTPENVDFTVSELGGDGNFGCRLEATGATLDDMSGDGMTITRDGDVYTFALEGSEDEVGDLEGMPAGMEPEVTIAATFPGAVIDAGGGEVDGNTVTWTGLDALSTGVTATGEAEESSSAAGSPILGIVLAVVLLLVLAAVVFFLARKKKTKDAGPGVDPTTGYAPPAPYAGGDAPYAPQQQGGYGAPQQQEGFAAPQQQDGFAAPQQDGPPAGYPAPEQGGFDAPPPPAPGASPVGYEQPTAQSFSAPTESVPPVEQAPPPPFEQSPVEEPRTDGRPEDETPR